MKKQAGASKAKGRECSRWRITQAQSPRGGTVRHRHPVNTRDLIVREKVHFDSLNHLCLPLIHSGVNQWMTHCGNSFGT